MAKKVKIEVSILDTDKAHEMVELVARLVLAARAVIQSERTYSPWSPSGNPTVKELAKAVEEVEAWANE